MKKGLIALVVTGPMVLPGFAGAREASSDAGRYRIVWKDVPAGRGTTQRLPFWVLKEEYRKGATSALTAEPRARTTRTGIEYRDVPAGRGETQSLPFIVRQ